MDNQRLFSEVASEATPQHETVSRATELFQELDILPLDIKVATINSIRQALSEHSPFSSEPVDCVLWVPAEAVSANDYNPNSVAPPEMELLRISIQSDGYTQPIVAWGIPSGYEVVDGFHRNRVGKECPDVRDRLHGYLPVAVIQESRLDKGDRIASTIRHNRARGKHRVTAMSDIVLELKRRNWSDSKIGRELGMDPDEVLRLAQITGLAEMFANRKFSMAWEAGGDIEEIINTTEETDESDLSSSLTMGGNEDSDVEEGFGQGEDAENGG